MATPLRMIVAADNVLTRAGLAALLGMDTRCEIVAQCSVDALLAQVDHHLPDILLLDGGWHSDNMQQVIHTAVKAMLPLVVLLNDEDQVQPALNSLSSADVYGVLFNDRDADLIMQALQAVYSGLIVIDPNMSDVLHTAIPSIDNHYLEGLTPRENDVLQLLARGLTNKAIAHDLHITEHTVKFHVNAIMTKLGAQSRTEAVVLATRAGWIVL